MATNAAYDKEFIELLIQEENSKSHSIERGGWDSDNNRWMPYRSLEGGKDTIGHGHKMFGDDTVTIRGEEIDLRKGLTDKQARDLLIQDIFVHQRRAQQDFGKFQPMGKKVAWRELPYAYRLAMTMVSFNPGLTTVNSKGKQVWGWPKLAKAMKADNMKGVLKEISRTHKGKQLGRVKAERALLKPMLKSIGTEEAEFITPLDKLRLRIPAFDELNQRAQVRLVARVVAQDQEIEVARATAQKEFDQHQLLLEEANGREGQNQRVHRERQEAEGRREAEETLQREVSEEQARIRTEEGGRVTQRLEEIDKSMTRLSELQQRTSDVREATGGGQSKAQFFQREDGKVIKVQEGQDPEEIF